MHLRISFIVSLHLFPIVRRVLLKLWRTNSTTIHMVIVYAIFMKIFINFSKIQRSEVFSGMLHVQSLSMDIILLSRKCAQFHQNIFHDCFNMQSGPKFILKLIISFPILLNLSIRGYWKHARSQFLQCWNRYV